MDAARWKRVQELFHAVADLAPAERAERLARECGDDRDLADAVQGLVDADGAEGGPLDGGIAAVARAAFDPPSPDDLPPPEAFAPYRVVERIGEGGMGVVYRAVRDDVGLVVAIKVLRHAWLSPARRERFAAERRTLAQLDHPSIARMHDAGTLPDGTPWFAMELVEGLPLTEYCRVRATSIEGRLELFRDVCVAVQHAHDQAVIHRDLKPSNLLVREDGSVKLLDFGIAKPLEALDGPGERTRTGLRLMTPAYAAPEQIRDGRAGIRSDVYALGTILYELLVGRLPDEAQRDNPPPPSVVVRRAGGPRGRSSRGPALADLDVLCRTAMHSDPERRYPTVDALRGDVVRALAGEPLVARRGAVGDRLAKFLRRHRTAVAAGVAAAAVAFAALTLFTARLAQARNEALAEAARAERIQRFMLQLFEGEHGDVGPSDAMRVVELFERGVEEARALDAEPEAQAELYRALGGIGRNLGRFERADALLRSAAERQRALSGPDAPRYGLALIDLGLLRADQAEFEEAERLVREGRAVVLRGLPPTDLAVARATAALGRVLEDRGRYDEAIAMNEDAVRLYERAGERGAEAAAALGQLADSRYYAGDYDTADAIHHDLLARYRALYGSQHPKIADTLANLAASRVDRGRWDEAEPFLRQALSILERWHGPDHHRTASARTMLGRALVYAGRLEEGTGQLRLALAVQERVHGPVHPAVASALNDLGSAALQREAYDEAEACFERMLDVYRATYGDGHYLLGIAISNLASVRTARGDHAGSEPLYRDAVARFARAQGPGHLNTGIARAKLGRALLRQGRPGEALAESQAGYDVLLAQAVPSTSWVRATRADLIAIHEALGDAVAAARLRAAATEAERRGAEGSATDR